MLNLTSFNQLRPSLGVFCCCLFSYSRDIYSNQNTMANPSLSSLIQSPSTTAIHELSMRTCLLKRRLHFTAAVRAQLNKLACLWRQHHWPEQCTMTQCLCFMKQESFGSVYLHTLKSIWLPMTLSSPAIILSPDW